MPGEFIARNGMISRGNVVVTGSLTTSGSLTTTGTITATTLVVQTITSSISSITGSTNFGSLLNNTHAFTGSILTSGSISIGGPAYAARALTAYANGSDFAATIQQNGSGAGLQVYASASNWSNVPFQVQNNSGIQFIVNSSGNVGVNTTNFSTVISSKELKIGSDTNGAFVLGNTTSSIYGFVYGSTNAIDIGSGNALTFQTWNGSAYAERARIYPSGGLAIVASSTNQTLTTGDAGVTRTNTYLGTGQLRVGGGSDHGANTVLSVAPGVITFDRPGVGGGALTINSSGYMTLPSQPSFTAVSNAGVQDYTSSQVIVFNLTRYNTSGNYNTGNGRFTAPVTGKYLFTVNFYMYLNFAAALTLTINGSQYNPSDLVPLIYRNTTMPESTQAFTLLLDLSANDYVEVRVRAGQSARVYMGHSHFSGCLLS